MSMEIKIETEYVTLGQFLKLADFISSGGEAKFAVKELDIIVNGDKEDRRGRKLYPNDVVVVEGQTFTIV
ncbi:S4 domain-containing protein YaaA [Breznakia blatticola]